MSRSVVRIMCTENLFHRICNVTKKYLPDRVGKIKGEDLYLIFWDLRLWSDAELAIINCLLEDVIESNSGERYEFIRCGEEIGDIDFDSSCGTFPIYTIEDRIPLEDEEELEISKVLTISTGHIREETAVMLERVAERYTDLDVPVVYKKGEYGYIVHISEDSFSTEDGEAVCGHEDVPADLRNCMLLAYRNGCDWLCLDRDGALLKNLPVFEW